MALVCLCRGNFYWPPHTTILFCSIFLDKIVLDTLKSRYHRSAPLGMLTNIIEETTDLLFVGRNADELVQAAFQQPCDVDSITLPGVVSRKKQLVSPLLAALEDENIVDV